MADPKQAEERDTHLALAALEGRLSGEVLSDEDAAFVDQLETVQRIITAFQSLESARPEPLPFPAWGPFVLKESIGRGTFGVVYRAYDPAVARDIAVKLYAGAELPSEPRLMARVRHSNVVTVFGAAVYDARPGIWMELVRGRTLAERVQARGPLPLDEVVRIGVDLCGALGAVHAAHLVHQDVKPRNVVEQDDGRIVLMDFGAGGAWVQQGSEPGRLCGTPLFMAPEVLAGKPPSVQSDVYSLGVVLYYLLTGTYPPYAADITELRRMHERQNDPAYSKRLASVLGELRPEIPKSLAVCVANALAPANHRWRSAAAFQEALLRTREDRGRSWFSAASSQARRWASLLLVGSLGLVVGSRLGSNPPAKTLMLKRVTGDGGLSTDPARSADGHLLAYASDRSGEGNLDIWVQQMSGGPPLRLTHDAADDSQPALSPDGSQVVFRSEREGGGLYIAPTLGGDARLVARDAHLPRFSPDGRWLSYFGGRGFATTLFIASLHGGPLRSYPATSPLGFAAGVWSPDSRRVLFTATDPDGTPDWWTVEVDDRNTELVRPTKMFRKLHQYSFDIVRRWPRPWDWIGDRILFQAHIDDTTNLWEVAVNQRTGVIQGAPVRVTVSTDDQVQPSRGSDGRLIFATRTERPYLAEIMLDPSSATARATPRPLLHYYPDRGVHDLSLDGRWLAFTSPRPGQPLVALKNLQTGVELALTPPTTQIERFPVLSPDNSQVMYGTLDDLGRRTIRLASTRGGIPEFICNDCGPPRDWSSDGRYVLIQNGIAERARLAVIELASGQQFDILEHPKAELYRGRFSPDSKWVAFHVAEEGALREYVAPFRGTRPVDVSEWIPITSGTSWTDAPCWSSDGNTMFYISDADGFRCLWAQRLDTKTKAPVGAAFAVQHLHGRKHSIANVDILAADLTAARDRLIVTMGELTGDVWLAEFK